jgi:hypothetical protein
MKSSIKIFMVLFLSMAVSGVMKAQDCVSYFPTKEGTVLEYQNFNAKDKLQGTSTSKILKKEVNGNNYSIKVQATSTDEKGKYTGMQEYTFKCENGVFIIDMGKFIDPATLEGFKNMDVKMTSENLEMPGVLKPGDVLKSGSVNVNVSNGGVSMMNMVVNITNRKVETIENITTPAGTFECYKLTSDVETKMMFKVESKVVEWYAKDKGMIRSENYDKNGKLQGYTILNKIQ